MKLRWADLRVTAAVACGALAVHELRWLIGYGTGAVGPSSSQGHGYLVAVVPVLVLVVALAAGQAIDRMSGRGRERAGRRCRAWLVLSAALFAVYSGQELLEGAVSDSRAGGLAAVFGQFGWTAVLVCLGVGALASLALRFADELETPVRLPSLVQVRRAGAVLRRLVPVVLPRPSVAGTNLAGRGPPAL